MHTRHIHRALVLLPLALSTGAGALQQPVPGDSRIRTVVYAQDEVYRLEGFIGYQVDLEFAPGENFVGLGAGDVDSLAIGTQANHLFLKPRVAGVATNLTVLTNTRSYHFEYRASARSPSGAEAVYVLRFIYPDPPAAATAPEHLEGAFVQAAASRPRNLSYAFRGSGALKPVSAWDDGVQTHLRFGARQELPAIFIRNDDGSESLVNFSVEADELIVHRVARELRLRRGQLAGCVVNEAFSGGGESLRSGTIAPAVERRVRGGPP